MSPLRSEPGRTRWVPCGPARLPTRRARLGLPRFGCWFYIGCGATNRVGHRAHSTDRSPVYPALAKLHRIAWTPLSPSTSARAGVTSKSGRGVKGPRSTTEVNTVFPPNSTKIFAPHGSTGWSTPSVFGPSSVPHPDDPSGQRPRADPGEGRIPAAHARHRRLRQRRPGDRDRVVPGRHRQSDHPGEEPGREHREQTLGQDGSHPAAASSSEPAPITRVYASTSSDGASPASGRNG